MVGARILSTHFTHLLSILSLPHPNCLFISYGMGEACGPGVPGPSERVLFALSISCPIQPFQSVTATDKAHRSSGSYPAKQVRTRCSQVPAWSRSLTWGRASNTKAILAASPYFW